MIIYVNIDKQTGNITVNNDIYPDDSELLQVNTYSILNNANVISFEIDTNIGRVSDLLGLVPGPPLSDPQPSEVI